MKTIIIITFALVLTICSLNAFSQQVPMFTHYMNNTLVVNPAYAGSRDALSVTALHRSQWVGFSGAPSTQTISLHTPFINKHIGLGLSVINDKIGPTNNTSIFTDYAFIMQVSERSRLALGISAGVNIYNANLNTLLLDEQQDPSFQTNIKNHTTFNFGTGIYYYRERFYAGISVPDIIQNNYALGTSEDTELSLIGKEQRHYFFIAGAMFRISENLGFKPTTLVKMTPAAPIQADFTASFIIAKRLLLGAMYRTGDAFGALVGFDITDQLHMGYSYDWSYGLKTSVYNGGSHEIFLRYDFKFFSKRQIHSPRYF